MIIEIKDFILDLIYPPRCVCGKIFKINDINRHICPECMEAIGNVNYENKCAKCGRETEGELCNYCQIYINNHDEFYFLKNYSLFTYENLGRSLIHDYKYRGNMELTYVFEKLFFNWYMENIPLVNKFDLIIPIPMSEEKEKKRGFNQSKLLANMISKNTNIPLDTESLFRVKSTKIQNRLSILDRHKNLENAFLVKKPSNIKGKNILLIDDIFTSGSTIINAAKALKLYNANSISSITLAITKEKEDENFKSDDLFL